MADQTEKRLSWLAFVYDSAIKYGVFRPADVMTHATPEVLANKLPTELLIRIFEVAFDAGKLTAEGILNGVAPPSTLVKHIPANVLWEVVRDAASRHGIAAVSANVPKTGKTPLRSWITEVLANGLEREIFTPADVTRNIPPGEWVKDVPLEVVAKMIAAGLTRPSFDPRLALEHLTPQVIGEYVAPHLAWGILEEGAQRAFELAPAQRAAVPRVSLKPPTVSGPIRSTPATAAHAPAPAPAPVVAPAAAADAATDWDNMVETVESVSGN